APLSPRRRRDGGGGDGARQARDQAGESPREALPVPRTAEQGGRPRGRSGKDVRARGSHRAEMPGGDPRAPADPDAAREIQGSHRSAVPSLSPSAGAGNDPRSQP